MCIKKVACGLRRTIKEDGREVLEPIFVEVDCPEDMSRISNKVEHCKTVTPKIVEENVQGVGIIPPTVQIKHVDVHDGHGGVTVNDAPTNNNDAPTNNNDSPITDNDSPTNNNGSPREVVCIDTGEIFANARQASLSTGIARQNICACCNGKRKKAGGKHWQYVIK